MNIAKITLLPALAFGLLLTTPSFAGNARFEIKFFNNTETAMNVKILHSQGGLHKQDSILPGKRKTFVFNQSCKQEHVRKFQIWDLQNDRRIFNGWIVMTTGRQKSGVNWVDCRNPSVEVDRCFDLWPTDDFEVECIYGGTDAHVKIRTETA